MLAASGVMDVPPRRSISILVRNFSDRKVRLPKHMIFAECEPPPDVFHAVDFGDQKVSPVRTSEGNFGPHSDTSAVHYKPAENRILQMSHHTVIQNNDTTRQAQNWQEGVHISYRNSAYHEEFITI